MIPGLDGSQFQGANVDFNQVKAAGYEFWFQRMTYCYPGSTTKIDPTAGRNYYAGKAAGLIMGGYHKVGWTDPIAEADAFLAAMSPLEDGDLVAHDMEPASDAAIPGNWSAWEQAYVQRIHDKTGLWSIRYNNISMDNSMPRQGVVTNCAPWVAAPSFGWDDTLPVSDPVVFQQGPTAHVPGVTANVVDTDMFFGTRDQLLAYAFKAQQAPVGPPVPEPTPAPVPEPAPVVAPVEQPQPVVEPAPVETPVEPTQPLPVPVAVTIPVKHWYDFILALIRALLKRSK